MQKQSYMSRFSNDILIDLMRRLLASSIMRSHIPRMRAPRQASGFHISRPARFHLDSRTRNSELTSRAGRDGKRGAEKSFQPLRISATSRRRLRRWGAITSANCSCPCCSGGGTRRVPVAKLGGNVAGLVHGPISNQLRTFRDRV